MDNLARQHILAVFIIILLISCVFSPFCNFPIQHARATGWWDSDWDYRKVINLANEDNNYQMLINVTKTSGGDVNCSGHCQNNFDDLRFINNAQSVVLDYWIEDKVDADYALVWVELPSTVTSDDKIYIYYGNVGASAASNGGNTFQYFDDWTSDNTGDWYIRFETGAGGNDTFHASIDVSGVADWDKVRLRYRMNRTSYTPANPHAGLRFGVADNDSWDATNQYPDNAVYWSDFYDAGCSDSTHNFYRIGVRDAADYTGGDDICLAFTPDDYRIWDLQVNGSAYTSLIKVYDDGYNFLETAVVTTTSALWPDTSLFDGILLGVYIDDGVHYWSHDATAGDGALRIGGERDGAPEDYNIALIDWMFLGEFNPTEPSVSSVGAEEEPPENSAPIISNEYPANNSWGVSGLTPTNHIAVSDADSDLINITWSWYDDGSWHVFGENLSVASGSTYYQPFVNGTDYNRNYSWNVSVNDGNGGWANATYYFTADVFFRKDTSNPITTSGASVPDCHAPDPVYNTQNDTWHLFYCRNDNGNRDIYRIDMDSPDMNGTAPYAGTAILTADGTWWHVSILKYIENSTAVYEDGKYWMYIADSVGDDIYYASSAYLDAPAAGWSFHATPILNNSGQAWHTTNLAILGFTVRKDTDGNYLMMYAGSNATFPHGLPAYSQIGYATATTKTSWTEYANNPVFIPSHVNTTPIPWDDHYFDYPSLQKRNDTYVMFYTGQYWDYGASSWANEELGYVTSTNMQDWTKYDWNPIGNTTAGTWDGDGFSDVNLAFNETSGTAYAFYEGEETSTGKYEIGRAWSDDFWNKLDILPANNPPIVESPNPVDTATGVSVSLSQISVWINDTEGDGINWTIETSPNIGSQDNSTAEEGNGSKVCTVSGLQGHITYTWYVNVTDNGGGWNNKTYTFTTENRVPVITDEYPVNQSIGVSITPTLHVQVNDSDADSMDITWYHNASTDFILDSVYNLTDQAFPYGSEARYAVYVNTTDTVYLFGGSTAPGYERDVWKWEIGSTPTQLPDATQAIKTGSPTWNWKAGKIYVYCNDSIYWLDPSDDSNGTTTEGYGDRYASSFAVYSPVQNKSYIFGGRNGTSGNVVNRTWVHDASASTFTRMMDNNLTLPVTSMSGVYVPEQDAIYLFGARGAPAYTMYDDIYRFNCSTETLTNLKTIYGYVKCPTDVEGMATFYHPDDQIIYCFGGLSDEPSYPTYQDKIWTFNPFNYTTSYPIVNLSITIPKRMDDFSGIFNASSGYGYLLPCNDVGSGDNDGDRQRYITQVNFTADYSWVQFATNTSVYNGTYYQPNSNFSEYDTTYWWRVAVDDGHGGWDNETYHFTTRTANNAPTQSGEVPTNGSTGISRLAACNVTCNDQDGDSLTVYFYENTTGSWVLQQTNSSHTANTSAVWGEYTNASAYGTTYYWSVNLTDGEDWNNETYHFTTNILPTLSGESPANSSTDIVLTPPLYVICTDADSDIMTATWRSNSSGAWVDFATNSSISTGTNITQPNSNFSAYGTTYYWSVNLTDGEDWNNETYHFTTMVNNLPTQTCSLYLDVGKKWKDLGVIDYVRAMTYCGNGIALIGASAGYVYRSTDYGATWSDLGVIASDTIYAMTYCGNGIALLGDMAEHVYRSTDYGATWSDLGVIVSDNVHSMTYCGNGIALLGDDAGHVYRSTDYGATWYDLGLIATGWVRSMTYCGNGIALLGIREHVYRSTDYGATWSDIGQITSNNIRTMVYCGSGIALLGDDDNHVCRSTDYGATWSDLGVIASSNVRSMTYCGNGIALLGDNAEHVYRSTDYGATWSDLGVIASGDIRAMIYCGSGIALLGDSAGHVFRSDGSTGISITPDLHVLCNDADNDNLNATWWSNSSGPWLQFASNWTSFANNTNITQSFTNATAYNTKYYWSLNLTDGTGWTNETYHFTTVANNPPVFSNEVPVNESTGIAKTITTINVTIEDPDGDTFNWTIETSPDVGSDSANDESNGSKSCSVSGLSSGTTYTWYVNCTDGTDWTNETYYFTTNYVPTQSDEIPANMSIDICLFPVLSVTVADNDAGNLMNITFYSNVSGSWNQIGVVITNKSNGTYRQKFDEFGVYGLKYWWNCSVSDGMDSVSSSIFSFTAEDEPDISLNYGRIKVYGTEYTHGEPGTVYAQVSNANETPANAANVYVTVWERVNKYIDGQQMIYIEGSNGCYLYNFTTPSNISVFMVDVNSSNPTAYGSGGFHVSEWSSAIPNINDTVNYMNDTLNYLNGTYFPALETKIDNIYTLLQNVDGNVTDLVALPSALYSLLNDTYNISYYLNNTVWAGYIASQLYNISNMTYNIAEYINTTIGYINLSWDGYNASQLFNISNMTYVLVDSIENILIHVNSTVTTIAGAFEVRLTEFGEINPGDDYLAQVTIFDSDGAMKNADFAPTISLWDSSGNLIVNNIPMTWVATGQYTYSYTTAGGQPAGQWTTMTRTTIGGEEVKNIIYWELESNPPEVTLTVVDNVFPSISAEISITNEGTGAQEYIYYWWITPRADGDLVDVDTVDSGSASKLIASLDTFTTIKILNVPTLGTYWYKVRVYWGTEWSAASAQFDAISAPGAGGIIPPREWFKLTVICIDDGWKRIPGVRVDIHEEGRFLGSELTNETGVAVFNIPKSMILNITAAKDGYETVVRSISVSGSMTEVIQMHKIAFAEFLWLFLVLIIIGGIIVYCFYRKQTAKVKKKRTYLG